MWKALLMSMTSSALNKKDIFRVSSVIEKELIVQKSRFIAILSPCSSFDEATILINEWKDIKASHNCWAFRDAHGYERYSDDGEPGGTAGRPILNALESESIIDAVILVIRHFGGIKLGTGGLTRAYHQAARDVIKASERSIVIETVDVQCIVNSNDIGIVYRVATSTEAVRVNETFQEYEVIMTFQIPAANVDGFQTKLKEATKGNARVTQLR
jgi:putative IMPACT (imprinted ancient) family translation regulator